ncbi:hypothetical protein VZT92_000352 [Zoarces viviparus]|uniref:Selenoprotein W n=1 Tax=Zoarces viviparus TaxID=48416 RepID=A0AAW1G5L9_ZOAVI
MATVSIEYWSLAGELERIPGVKVTGQVGRSGSFEVTVNGQLIFSKLQKGKFPDPKEVAEEVKNCIKNGHQGGKGGQQKSSYH